MNITLAQRVLDQIDAHPELHSQSSFKSNTECGTRHCIAGWTLELADTHYHWESWQCDAVREDGKEVEIDTEAAELLGIPPEEAYQLFYDFEDEHAIATFRKMVQDARIAADPLQEVFR